ncbi:MAG: TIGR03862 family flavoprotein, partial [Chthoniobacterales bacterium]
MANGDDCILVIGGGPAGLRAAEVASAAGARVILCDGQSSAGRKFLVAGRGGLNLTHGEPVENFPMRYGEEPERWRDLLAEFSPKDLQAWATQLGVETYIGSSGRVFPRGQKAAGLLRAWLQRLRVLGVEFRLGARWLGITREQNIWRADFESPNEQFAIKARAIVLALGGASWPETGSDGKWPAILAQHGIEITPWAPANCGWEVDWPAGLLERAEGLPLKNLTVSAGVEAISGELLITRYGVEGGTIYRLGPILRAMAEPQITIDLKPQLSTEAITQRLASSPKDENLARTLKMSPAAAALLEFFFAEELEDRARLASRVKNFPLRLRAPRPIVEAISSAGGIAWS